MEVTCINCPVGCRMTVEMKDHEVVSVTGNTCKRGEIYARQECVNPMRMVTAVVPVAGSGMPVSVKTRTPIPKALIGECMKVLASLSLQAPIEAGQVICPDVCHTGVDVIATKSVTGREA